jgi:PhnB protein
MLERHYNFIKKYFKGEVSNLQTYGEADYPTPPEADNRIIHAQFKSGDLFFMASDASLGMLLK